MNTNFVHLHCHSHYSLLDGASRIPDLVKHCKSMGMQACAVTDHGNLYGMAEFLRVAKDEHFKPIVGMEAYVAGGDRTKKEGGRSDFHLTLLAKDGEGVRNLMRLSSRAFLEGYYYVPRIDKKILKEHSKGIICLSGCASAEFSKLLLEDDSKGAIALCQWYMDVFGDDFYVEIQENGVQIQRDCAVAAIDIAEKMGLPVVATSDAHYLRREDAPAHDVLLCINTGKTLDDPKRMRFDTDQFHVRSAEEMYESLSDFENVDEYIGLSGEIADGVEDGYGSLDFGRRQFPSFAVPRGDADSYLAEVCRAGIAPRYGEATPEIEERLNHELGIISKMGFSSYFLIVWDFVDFARRSGIPVSARGSGCGALVSYLLGISNFCPMKHGLLFERFLDPNRSDPPDIDIDICKERRAEVVAYVVAKYGEDCVGKIGTFGTMAAKSVLKDVGRTLDIPIKTIEDLNKNISNKPNTKLVDVVKGDDAKSKEFVRMVNADPALGRALGYATVLEGTARSAGVHAAGVVISPRPLADLVPMQRDKHGVVCTQWTMYDLEKAGMLKMDFLGLRNMTMLRTCADMLGMESTDEFYRLPQDDPAVFRLMQRGQTDGVFQLDGDGMQELLVRVRPDRFDDVGAILALFRPGPLEGGMVDQYVDVKHGRKKANYIHPVMEEILAETYGVIVYQESIMKILNRLGGMELGQAYACIKAISKKKPDQVAKNREAFESGASRLIDRKTAEKIFDLITFFGGYGFNKCISSDTRILRYGANKDADNAPYTVEEMYNIATDAAYARKTGHYNLHKKWKFQGHYGMGLSLCEDGRVRQNRIMGIKPAGVRTVFKIMTEDGRSIRVTGNHKFPTPSGETRADELVAGGDIFICGEYETTDKHYGFSQVTQEMMKNSGKEAGIEGENNYSYTNGSFTLYKRFRDSEPDFCKDCGKDCRNERIEVHHIDGNRENSNHDNLVKLCPGCHKKREYAAGRTKRGQKGYPAYVAKIASIEPDGECMTYDVTMDAPNHTFAVKSGIITCNSHAIAYAYIAWATAWVKAHHPRVFAAALLSSEMEGAERDKYFEEHVRDCRRRRIEILPPDINKSGCEFLREGPTTQEGGGAVRFGLSAIKGVGSDLMRGVVAARGDRPFSGFRDFLARTAVQSDKAAILIKSGALDCLGETRPAMLAAVAAYVKDEKNGRKDAARGQGRLFGDEPDDAPLPKGEDYSQGTLDNMMIEAIGCELGPHPAAEHEARILEFASGDLAACKTKNGDIIIGGVARNVQPRTIAGKRPGEPNRVMLTFDFDDMSGSTNVVAWPDHARAVSVKDGWVGLLAGRFERGKYTQFVAERAWPIEDAESAFAKAVVVEMVSAEQGAATPDRLKRVMAAHPGPTPLYFKIWDGERWNWLECGKRFRVRASRRLVEELDAVAGEGSASTTAHAPHSRKG